MFPANIKGNARMAQTELLPRAPAQKAGREIPASAVRTELAKADQLRKAGKLNRAQVICEDLIDQYPDYVAALHTLGLIHLTKEQYWPALSCFIRAAMLNPKDPTILINLGNVYFGLGAGELSTQTLELAKTFDPDNPIIYSTLGRIYDAQREYELAVGCFEHALSLDPADAAVAFALSSCYLHMGRIEDAAARLKQSYESNPDSVDALGGLAHLPPSLVDIDVLSEIERRGESGALEKEEVATRRAFAKAAALDKLGRTEEAWNSLVEANVRPYETYKASYKEHRRRADHALQEATNLKVKPRRLSADPSEVPISLFILGPSRSGKTTLEGLVDTIDGVKRGYENPIVQNAVRRTLQLSGFLTLDVLAVLPEVLNDRFTGIYIEELLERAGDAKVFTNTHPGRVKDVGRMAATLPKARFVFVKRDIHDIALRIYMKHYRKGGNVYAYDIRTIFEEIEWYHRMFDLWAEKIPQSCVVVRYEDMIENPHLVLSQVADLCGLAMPSGPLPTLGDDRGCAVPYRAFLDAAREQ
jgi:tetratricopeptide (TPR) repeat protein